MLTSLSEASSNGKMRTPLSGAASALGDFDLLLLGGPLAEGAGLRSIFGSLSISYSRAPASPTRRMSLSLPGFGRGEAELRPECLGPGLRDLLPRVCLLDPVPESGSRPSGTSSFIAASG